MHPFHARPETRRRSGVEAPARDEGRPAWTRSEAFAEDVDDAPAPLAAAPAGPAGPADSAPQRPWLALFGFGLATKPMTQAR